MKNLGVLSTTLSPWSHWSLSLSKGVAIGSIVVMFLLAACSDDPKVGGTEEDAGIIAIENKTVSGVSQKGPFVNGSSVKLYEMDGETLAPTGKSFPGKIASDDGRFTVPSISLASQYALLEANGYFRNEITGGKSNGTITLNALTDLSDREKVNINLLTHLEYERALYLVGTGVKVSEAKKQAESEILDAFEIKGEFENSEDLDIFSSGDGNAALLAFSVLMLGNLTEADLTERLTNFATDVEQDGKWDDEKTKAIIADWASGMSLADGLAGIRNNIAGWNFSNDVPAFEKYVNNFWWQNYGLGTCDSKREGEILQASNLLSANNGVHFICNNAAWRVATDLEKDIYKLGSCKDNETKNGNVSKLPYSCVSGQWIALDIVAMSEKFVCGDMWCANEYSKNEASDYRIQTGIDGPTDNSGYWNDFDDHEKGGASSLNWPVSRGNMWTGNAFDPVIDVCRGVCARITLDKGSLNTNIPYVGVYFDVAGATSYVDPTPTVGDATAWGGICVVYSSSIDIALELAYGNVNDASLNDNLPQVKLPSGKNVVKNFSWDEFTQLGQIKTITGFEAAQKLASVRFTMRGDDGDYFFNIHSVGTYGSCKKNP